MCWFPLGKLVEEGKGLTSRAYYCMDMETKLIDVYSKIIKHKLHIVLRDLWASDFIVHIVEVKEKIRNNHTWKN
jgi:hypothetical protein